MIEIRTYPHTDENGIRTLRDDNCPGICAKGSATPDVCIHYSLKSAGEGKMIELCSRDEECET